MGNIGFGSEGLEWVKMPSAWDTNRCEMKILSVCSRVESKVGLEGMIQQLDIQKEVLKMYEKQLEDSNIYSYLVLST